MTQTHQYCSFLALVLLLGACGNPNGAPPASPNHDVQPPTTTTGNGEVMGADRVPPAQKLEEGPTLDPQGIKPAKQPARD